MHRLILKAMTNLLLALLFLPTLAALLLGVLILRRLNRAADAGLDQVLRAELRGARDETAQQARNLREEVAAAQTQANALLVKTVSTLGADQKDLLGGLTTSIRLEQAKERDMLEQKFRQIQEGNEKKLDEMRQTVDEKLHNTLEKRLGESFKLVSDRLEAVQRGLGEMRSLANGVGDLKRVLTNVKERGTWGEYQLGAILDDILTPDQFAKNVRLREGGEQVEFAVKLPGKGQPGDAPVWMPIDAKFPKEDYERLLEAADRSDGEQVKAASKALSIAILKSARDIHDKYVAPPATTDFGIMFLPTEGLYAEVLRQPGLHDELQRKYRVLVAGPTTLSAILSSLRVGFQTLAIEQRAHEVWMVLGAVKTEFGKFGAVLDKLKKQLNTASNTLEETSARSRAMERRLRVVEQLPDGQSQTVVSLAEQGAETDAAAVGDEENNHEPDDGRTEPSGGEQR